MSRQHLLLAAPFCYLAATADAFSLRSDRSSLSPTFVKRTPLCLRAEAEASDGEPSVAQPDSDKDHGEHTGEEWQLPTEGGSDILNSPAFLKRKIDVLKSDIEKAEFELEEANFAMEEGKKEWGPELDALQKEYGLMQDRMARQSKEGGGDATIQVARKMLEVMDNYDRAFGAVEPSTDEEHEIEAAYKKTYQMILDTFENLGITEVETVGTEFDYEVHQAVMQRPSEDYEEGIVCEELAKGWKLGDKLIRAAMVSVAA